MRTVLLRLTTLAVVIVSLSPPTLRAQEGITVTDFSTPHNPAFYSLPSAKIRRGVTSTVTIVKNLIDLVPFDQIKVHSGSTTISGLSNGRTQSSGTGFISMKMTVPAGATVGSTVTLDVGFLDHFTFTVQHTGQLSEAPRFQPNPSTVVAGTDIVIKLNNGVDFGNPTIVALCHTVSAPAPNTNDFSATLTRQTSGTCATNNGPFSLSVHGSGTGDPSLYTTAAGTGAFSIPAYLVPPVQQQLTCASVPNISAPTITHPANQQVFTFAQGANASQQLAVIWRKKTSADQLAPNNEWLVTLAGSGTTIRDTVFTRSYPVPGNYTVSVRARNCDTPAGTATVSFSLKFQ